jgi:hypothetical protein
MGDVEVLRRAWPDVLQTLSKIKRSTWALVEPNAQVSAFDGQTLTLSFTTTGLAGQTIRRTFGRRSIRLWALIARSTRWPAEAPASRALSQTQKHPLAGQHRQLVRRLQLMLPGDWRPRRQQMHRQPRQRMRRHLPLRQVPATGRQTVEQPQ